MLRLVFMCVGVCLYRSLISYSVSDCTSSLRLHLHFLAHIHGEHTPFFSWPDQIRSEVECPADVPLWWVGFSFHALSIFLPLLSITSQICSMAYSHLLSALKKPSDRFSRIKMSFISAGFFFLKCCGKSIMEHSSRRMKSGMRCRLSLLCNISLSEGIRI